MSLFHFLLKPDFHDFSYPGLIVLMTLRGDRQLVHFAANSLWFQIFDLWGFIQRIENNLFKNVLDLDSQQRTILIQISLCFLDHHSDWSAEDGPSLAAGARRPQVGPLLRVRRRCPHAAHVHLRPHRPLAGLHLVRHRQRGEAVPRAQDRMAGQPGGVHRWPYLSFDAKDMIHTFCSIFNLLYFCYSLQEKSTTTVTPAQAPPSKISTSRRSISPSAVWPVWALGTSPPTPTPRRSSPSASCSLDVSEQLSHTHTVIMILSSLQHTHCISWSILTFMEGF